MARCPTSGQIVYRLDAGYGYKSQLNWLQAEGYTYLCKAAGWRHDKWAAWVSNWQAVAEEPRECK